MRVGGCGCVCVTVASVQDGLVVGSNFAGSRAVTSSHDNEATILTGWVHRRVGLYLQADRTRSALCERVQEVAVHLCFRAKGFGK